MINGLMGTFTLPSGEKLDAVIDLRAIIVNRIMQWYDGKALIHSSESGWWRKLDLTDGYGVIVQVPTIVIDDARLTRIVIEAQGMVEVEFTNGRSR